jgi:hypothetical protein
VAGAPLPSLPDVGAHDLHGLVRGFAERWVNWDWRDAEAPYRALPPVTAGPLRGELARTREAVAADSGLRRQRLGSRGHFVALAIEEGKGARRLVVVVREELLLGGRGELEGPRHRVYLAAARRTAAGWRMTRWERQP